MREGLKIVELEFPDGSSPPKSVIKEWLRVVKEHFGDPAQSHQRHFLRSKTSPSIDDKTALRSRVESIKRKELEGTSASKGNRQGSLLSP